MFPTYLKQPSAISLPERDRDQSHFISPFNMVNDHTCSFSSPVLLHSLQDQDHRDHHLHQVQHLQQEQIIINEQHLLGDLSNCCSVPYPRTDRENSRKMESSERVKEEFHVPGEWMPSKMRIMRKMMHSDRAIAHTSNSTSRGNLQEISEDQTQSSKDFSSTSSKYKSNSPCGMIRFCSNCHTTKTPLWRSGPSGPKSLCNACGIRQRKARRAMAMAVAAAAGGGLVQAVRGPAAKKRDRKVDVDGTVPFKKRCKFTNAIRRNTTTTTHKKKKKKVCLEDHVKQASSFHQVFPQDERDAAILLMALSCEV